MKVFPSSAFGRIAALIAFLLLINQVIYYYSVNTYIIQPQWQRVVNLLAAQIKVVFMDIDNGIPDNISKAFTEATGITMFDAVSAQQHGLGKAQLEQELSKNMSKALGKPTEVRLEEGDKLFAWVKPQNSDELWVRLPLTPFENTYPLQVLLYLSAISILSIAGGWFFARQLSRPLRRLQFAARELGRGDTPGDLKEQGTAELIAVTQAFNKMARDVQQLEDERTILLAGISHDLRTPLTRIRLASEFLPATEADIQQGIIRDTEDMDNIIQQFIAYVKDGREEPCIWLDLNQLLLQIIDTFNDGDRIETQRESLPKMKLRPLAIKRMLGNLLQNALRYSEGKVILKAAHKQHQVIISVIDKGNGIDEPQLEKLFQPFKRGDEARGGGGSGLGLSIVRRLAAMHDGTVELTNHIEGGLIATVYLPVAQKQSSLPI